MQAQLMVGRPTPSHLHVHLNNHRYPNVYVFRYNNMRTEQFKELRQDLKESSR
jgi:hypothetical protein